MAKKKRVTRKELLKGPDEFVTFSARAIQFAADNQKAISYFLAGLLVFVLALAVFRYLSTVSERQAYAVFSQGLMHYVGQPSGEQSRHFRDIAKERFAEVLNKYSSTSAARLSLSLYGDISYEEGSYDKAIELYERALEAFSEDDALRKLTLNGLGYAYEGKKDYDMAAQCFQKITGAKGDFLKADAYFNLGRMYEAISNGEKAYEAYSTLTKDYPGSANSQIAKERVRRLKEQG